MIFNTFSGSTYELDQSNKRIRRLNGVENPTPRQGADGEWKTFASCSNPEEDKPVVIHWEAEKLTITSVVVSINQSTN